MLSQSFCLVLSLWNPSWAQFEKRSSVQCPSGGGDRCHEGDHAGNTQGIKPEERRIRNRSEAPVGITIETLGPLDVLNGEFMAVPKKSDQILNLDSFS